MATEAQIKAISLHGIGLYIYAGEDLPITESSNQVRISETDLKE